MTHRRQILYVVRPITTTPTCFPEPATSSGHLSLLHLGDESVIRPLDMCFTSLLSAFPQLTATSSSFGTLSSSLAILGALLAFHIYFRVCVSASTSCICVLRPHHRVLSLSKSSQVPSHCVSCLLMFLASPAIFTLATCHHQPKSKLL